MSQGKIIVISAPSGSGKSTIINSILEEGCFDLDFSVSATNRNPRPGEEDGVHYHFLSTEEFRNAVDSGQFIEWEEVYPGRYYGTLRSEIDRMLRHGHNVILDIDVRGALNVKKIYGDTARTIFIAPPSIEELRRRLEQRGTDDADRIATRVGRAAYEINLAPEFDERVVNDDLDTAIARTKELISAHIDN
ncbi:MAG: guanylate kinase [Bacteroides sp.]|nr:guanylate kinase [Bacteroides sp.]MCM1094806.1 guanylate kinase [Terasakiella sp.]